MKARIAWILPCIALIVSCRETIGDKPSAVDVEMEKRIIGNWIFESGNPPVIDSTILFFDFSKKMTVIDYGIHDTMADFYYKIRDSVLTLISFSGYSNRYEIDYQIDFLNSDYLILSRYRNHTLLYTKTYRRYQ